MSAQRLAIAAASRVGGPRPRARRTSELPVRGPGGLSITRGDRPDVGANGTPAASGRSSAIQRAVEVATLTAVSATANVAGRNGAQTIRRSTTTTTTTTAAAGGSGSGLAGPSPSATDNGSHDSDHGRTRQTAATGIPSTTEVLDRVDEMMTQLEERILEELERRGGRFTGTF